LIVGSWWLVVEWRASPSPVYISFDREADFTEIAAAYTSKAFRLSNELITTN
jgi:hypothetical protein